MTLLVTQPWSCSLAGSLSLFRKVKVSRARMLTSRQLAAAATSHGPYHRARCANQCSLLAWCDVWCADASSEQCLFSDMMVVAGYSESNIADALACYTRRHKDLAVTAIIQGTANSKNKVKENLVDGIYDRHSRNMLQNQF